MAKSKKKHKLFKWEQFQIDQKRRSEGKEIIDVKKGYTRESRDGFYNKAPWKKLRDSYILKEPLCEHCRKLGRCTPATMVDHVLPVCDFPDLSLDYANLQSLCDYCHRVKTNQDKVNRKLARKREKGALIMEQFESE